MAVFKVLTPADIVAFSTGLIAGVDEVGRGPLVGDVVTAAVILDPNQPISGLNDSKKLSEKRREALFDEICEKALCYHIGRASPAEIDELNILHATMLAMQRAVAGLNLAPKLVLVDGNRSPFFSHNSQSIVSHSIIKGDGLIASISAASIIAKVTRDREMDALDAAYPQYGFAKHKGYPTKAHFEAIAEHGVFDQYRKSFKPVKALLEG
ncbi:MULTISPECIES: ribonuclease HII [Shewanella]|uniref:Ribonuclease HII n=2 Tax=Shewanella TaxID=22 RepID=RNH2_SHESW|nr:MULTISPECIES: ribonuclease HII [Shewanella]A1RLL3.1 RecName: Full=Ribonuclease HII; Short=RNase HII [Shewanella sp. W3-18-1]A4Y557.1 RecName: Full=Ribonuclease HII; Short=RNase HII [Shewanella putrefaciens CN-32]ABM25558.1 RNase HII [Shewanella sp. W3-18-1]QGS50461.1 ribonuclease HII [Shewanella putrefaciens]SUI60909.1 Ribonuclease HII [Shewanella putrefaciens]